MLVLGRGRNESVLVGDDVKVTLLEVQSGETVVVGAKARLGFDAPDDVTIQRQEVFDRMAMKGSGSGGPFKRKPKPHFPGHRDTVRDAIVRLQIEAPPATAIHCSRASGNASGPRRVVQSFRIEPVSADRNGAPGGQPEQILNCRKGDNILIGNRLVVTIVDVFRFVFDSPPARSHSSSG